VIYHVQLIAILVIKLQGYVQVAQMDFSVPQLVLYVQRIVLSAPPAIQLPETASSVLQDSSDLNVIYHAQINAVHVLK